ncbi:MAG: Uncharacterized protein LiPW39_314 [Parcubacteria group bacterium LiPW_39]|nr:MAG: Uncharacterized protein LiPW39_314 [Parcubacteria group bacterium LiPW_39]
MNLSIIVTNYKTPELLKLCLESVKIAGAGLDYEILVLDSESQEETGEILKEDFPEVKYFPFKKNTGYARLVNAGLARAGGRYILILNADIILFKDSLQKMVEYLEKNPKVGMLGPQLLNFNGTVQESCFRFHRPMSIVYRRTFLGRTQRGKRELARFAMKDFDRQSIKEVDWILGAALMLKKAAMNQVGPMDERFFLYFEDTDWCRRFWAMGWQVIYFPEAKIHHYHGRLSKKTSGLTDLLVNKYTWIHIASAIKYFLKYR